LNQPAIISANRAAAAFLKSDPAFQIGNLSWLGAPWDSLGSTLILGDHFALFFR
jgi:hypothetical protein